MMRIKCFIALSLVFVACNAEKNTIQHLEVSSSDDDANLDTCGIPSWQSFSLAPGQKESFGSLPCNGTVALSFYYHPTSANDVDFYIVNEFTNGFIFSLPSANHVTSVCNLGYPTDGGSLSMVAKCSTASEPCGFQFGWDLTCYNTGATSYTFSLASIYPSSCANYVPVTFSRAFFYAYPQITYNANNYLVWRVFMDDSGTWVYYDQVLVSTFPFGYWYGNSKQASYSSDNNELTFTLSLEFENTPCELVYSVT